MNTETDDRIRDAVQAISRSAQTPRNYADLRDATTMSVESRRPRSANVVAAVAGLALVGVAVTAILFLNETSPAPSGDAGTVSVTRYTLDYTATPNAVCDSADPTDPGRFRQSHAEVWVDDVHHRARMRTTYPDGSTRDLITDGAGAVPDQLFERGDTHADLVGCGLGVSSFLDPASEPFIPQPDQATTTPPWTMIPGEHRDSLGRTARLFTNSSPTSVDGPSGHVDGTDEAQLFLTPEGQHLSERVVTTRWGTGAVVTHRVTYDPEQFVRVASETFSTDGYHDISAAHTTATTSPART